MDNQTLIYIILILVIICLFKNDLINILNIKKSNEPFFDIRSELIQGIADKLLISSRRIINFNYTGDISKNQLSVSFGIDGRNALEVDEPTNSELLETINYLFDTNTFAVIYQDKIINLSSNSQVNFDSRNNNQLGNNNSKNNNQSGNNVKPREDFEQYYCNVNNKFDNTNLLRVKNLVDAKYRNFPYDESLTKFISVDNSNGKLVATNTPSSCPT